MKTTVSMCVPPPQQEPTNRLDIETIDAPCDVFNTHTV
jgi:hypothetical protein